jgi:hypothetical protein
MRSSQRVHFGIVFGRERLVEQNGRLRGGGDFGKARAQQFERGAVEYSSMRASVERHLIHGIERGVVLGEEDHAGEHRGRRGQQSHARFGHHAERAFRAHEQVDPIHAGPQQIAGGVLGDGGQRDGAGVEIDGVAAGDGEHAPSASTTRSACTQRRVAPKRKLRDPLALVEMVPPRKAEFSVGSGG